MGKYKEVLESMQMFVYKKDSLLSQENIAGVSELQVRSIHIPIDNMLEGADLDVSQEKLSCEHVEFHCILQKEMKWVHNFAKPEIEYLLDILQEYIIIITYAKYLGLSIVELLNNAGKFTELYLFIILIIKNDEININVADNR